MANFQIITKNWSLPSLLGLTTDNYPDQHEQYTLQIKEILPKLNILLMIYPKGNTNLEENNGWAAYNATINTDAQFDPATIKHLLLHIYLKCGNFKFYQKSALMSYYKNMQFAYGTHKLMKIEDGIKNKWQFDITIKITYQSEIAFLSTEVLEIVESQRIYQDNISHVNWSRTRIPTKTHQEATTEPLIPLKPISSQSYIKSSSDIYKQPLSPYHRHYLQHTTCKVKKNNNNIEEMDQDRPYKKYLTISDKYSYAFNHIMYGVKQIANIIHPNSNDLFDFIPNIDCFASANNHKCSLYITIKDNFFSYIYQDKQYWNNKIAWCTPPYNRKIIVDTMNLFKTRNMKGYVMIPYDENQLWMQQAKRISHAWYKIGKRVRTPFQSTPLPWYCWFETIIFYFNYQK